MFWDNWIGLADRVTNLEKENAILKGTMAIMLEMLNQDGEDIQDLRLETQEILCNYVKHLYHYYHGVKNMDGKITFKKNEMTLEEELELAKIEQTLKDLRKKRS